MGEDVLIGDHFASKLNFALSILLFAVQHLLPLLQAHTQDCQIAKYKQV